ncbi:MAG: OB-fold nucleic acid binding domain-containing protein [bacterium]|nr:OB-fold nucleic acid binding domain-containing protein [bacterium]
MAEKKIKDYVVEDNITGFFVVRTKNVREYTRGQYVQMELGDSTGRISANMWEPDSFALNELEAGFVVKVRGQVGEYRNKLQLTVGLMRLATEDEYAIEDILPHSTQTYEQRKARILALTEKIENSYIKQLVQLFWDDEPFFDRFLTAAAGKLWHHAYVGGLSEHSANLGELALRVSAGYDYLDKDLLIFGGIFHDIGKVDTYTADMAIDYTDRGRLVGHICIADAWIAERAKQIENFPDNLLTKLRHIILSHQGQLDYATPVVPQMPEAFVVYYCDEIDSKMGAIDRIRQRQGGKGWSDWVNLLGRHLYFGEAED